MNTMRTIPLLCALLILAGCAAVQTDWEFTQRLNTPCGYEVFAEKYPASDQAREALSRVEELHWEQAVKEDSVSAYEQFQKRHPDSRYFHAARQSIEAIRWEQALEDDTPEAYREFLDQYPESRFSSGVLEEMSWDEAVTADTEDAYERYLHDYPQGRYAEEAGQSLEAFFWRRTREMNTPEAYRVYLRRYPWGRFTEDAERAIEIAKRLEVCTAVSPVMKKQIEEEVLTFIGRDREQSLIEYVEDFRYSVTGISVAGAEVEMTEYAAEGRQRKVEVRYYVALGEENGSDLEDAGPVVWKPSEKAVTYRRVTAPGSTLKLKDGRIFTYGNGTWNECKL